MKQRKNIIIALIVIGIVLLFSGIRSCYYAYKEDKNYELKGWQTAIATCIEEKTLTKTTIR